MDNLGPYNSGPEYLAATGMYPLSAIPTDRAERIMCASRRGTQCPRLCA